MKEPCSEEQGREEDEPQPKREVLREATLEEFEKIVLLKQDERMEVY